MKVIVTGSNGNLGTHIQKYADFKIYPLNRSDWVNIDDICRQKIESVIHTAYDLKKSIYEHPDDVLTSNIITTAKMLKKCLLFNIPKFIFISSCSVYGDSTNTSEDSKCAPITLNGLTKLLNEKLIIDFCKKHKLKYLILRVFNSYGGNDSFSVFNKLVEAEKSGHPFTLFNNGQAERDFIHIDDVAQIICKLAKNDIKNEIINIGTGKSIKIIKLVKEIERKYGPVNTMNKININEIMSSCANIEKLENLMSFQFKNIIKHIQEL